VSLFSSFIAVIAVGSEAKISQMTLGQYHDQAGFLSVAEPKVFIGLLIGGCVPFLFSSQLIRAVGRAAYYIVQECRAQFKDAEIWAGTKKPDYGRVVDICTNTAQKELVGPGLLAITAPILVGLLLGPYALGGFLAGLMGAECILSGISPNIAQTIVHLGIDLTGIKTKSTMMEAMRYAIRANGQKVVSLKNEEKVAKAQEERASDE